MSPVPGVLLGLIAGALIAVAHVRTLATNVRWLAEGRAGPAVALQLARMALLVVAMLGLVRLGPPVLVGAAVGLIGTRMLLLRHAAGERP